MLGFKLKRQAAKLIALRDPAVPGHLEHLHLKENKKKTKTKPSSLLLLA